MKVDRMLRRRILLIEDDPNLGPLVTELLSGEFDVHLVAEGRQGLRAARTEQWAALVVDRRLPGMDGLAVIRAMRAAGVATPVIVLTALGTVPDKVDGLDAGANDYLTKPFDAAELAARLRALTRDYGRRKLTIGSWDIDPDLRLATSGYGGRVSLTVREIGLLSALAAEPDRVHDRARLLAGVFGPAESPGIVDTYVYYLRRKLGANVIRTVRGIGYQAGE